MTGIGHTMTGFAMAAYPASLVVDNGLGFALLAALGCVIGSTAPDWLELPRAVRDSDGARVGTKRLISHRTWTHVFTWWLLFTWLSISLAVGDRLPFIDNISFEYKAELYAFLMGFAIGGTLHLICDMPNKQKVPIFTPFDGFSLNLWKSGKNEWVIAVLVQFVSLYMAMEGVSPPLLSELL